MRELNRVGAAIGREIADRAGRPVIVAGSMGPTGEIMAPMGPLTHEAAVEMFHEQAEGLKAGGADVLWVETISAPEEYKAAAEAAQLAGMPWCGTMSFDTAGRTMMGHTSADMVTMVGRLPHPPLAFGANCGVGASDLLRTVLGFGAQGTERPIIAKGNAGIPKYHDGHIHYDGTPELMADYAVLARDCGAKIIGGCCGTTPDHLVKMREALETRPAARAPASTRSPRGWAGFPRPRTAPMDGAGPHAAGAAERSRRTRRRQFARERIDNAAANAPRPRRQCGVVVGRGTSCKRERRPPPAISARWIHVARVEGRTVCRSPPAAARSREAGSGRKATRISGAHCGR